MKFSRLDVPKLACSAIYRSGDTGPAVSQPVLVLEEITGCAITGSQRWMR